MKPRPAPIRGWNFEYLMWLFLRLSGLALYALAIFSVSAALYLGARTQMDMSTLLHWTFFPNSSHLSSSEVDVTLGWVGVLWQTLQATAVFFGVTHGFNGLRNILEDFLGDRKGLRTALRVVLFLLWAFMTYAALTLVLADKAV
jgi:succinate dehydrogenase hydrophobic anchor subunit